ncbi:glucan endo-1 [Quercus suber]|uniref:glucan endo-1,3-beta-D-glucosidase n=1 Tax=Quercus suber TaxID=58331 RepID=A0AAW0INS0_QUESU
MEFGGGKWLRGKGLKIENGVGVGGFDWEGFADLIKVESITIDDFTNVDILEATSPAVARSLLGDWVFDPAISFVTGFLGKVFYCLSALKILLEELGGVNSTKSRSGTGEEIRVSNCSSGQAASLKREESRGICFGNGCHHRRHRGRLRVHLQRASRPKSFSGLTWTPAQSIGVNYGTVADNLPPATDVITLYTTNGIGKMRIFDPNQATLQALKGSNIEVIVGVVNNDLQGLATSPATANTWVQTNIIPYPDVKISYIAAGNEIKPSDPLAQYVGPAIQNLNNAITASNLQIKVSTVIDMSLLGNSSPPSAGSFSDSASSYINAIVSILVSTNAPLLANVYPYIAYTSDPTNIKLEYALFTSPGVVVQDGNLGYQNLFDAILDSLYSALEKIGGANLTVIVTESGWPSDGDSGVAATVNNAGTYYKNLISHVKNGTPKKPGPLETYLFAMFDEDQKGPAETEKHFGLFSPTKEPKYQLTFT